MERVELKRALCASGCAVERGEWLFLCDPHASAAERAQTERILETARDARGAEDGGWLCVRTGGTGGTVKFARHDERTIGAAVRGFCGHFATARVNAVSVLPLHHVSGLMAWARGAFTGGEFLPWDWKKLEAGELPTLPSAADGWMISLVPTQLQRLLASERAVEWLRSLRVIFLGGGPSWPELTDAAARAGLRLALSYGMTETAAMVTALRPEEFLAGARTSGAPLPHARVTIDAVGAIVIAGESVFRGYFPERRDAREFTTEDLGAIDAHGHLHVLGRRDALIITGGKKVQPAEVEAALRASGEFSDIAVIGVPDAEWGEAVVAFYPAGREPDLARAVRELAGHQRPKRFIAVAAWPRNAQGKLNRAALRELALAQAG